MDFELLLQNEGFSHIPQQIFGYLDPESLANCRLVRKSWSIYVRNSIFGAIIKAAAFKAAFSSLTRIGTNAEWNLERRRLWIKIIYGIKKEKKKHLGKLIDLLQKHCPLDKASDSPNPDDVSRECLFEALRALESLLETDQEDFVEDLLKYLPTKYVHHTKFHEPGDRQELSLLCFFAAAKSLPKLFIFLLQKANEKGLNVFDEIRNEYAYDCEVQLTRQHFTYQHLAFLDIFNIQKSRHSFLQKLIRYCTFELPSIEMLNLVTEHMPEDEWTFRTDNGLHVLHILCEYRLSDDLTKGPLTDLINFILDHSGIDVNVLQQFSYTPLMVACNHEGSSTAAKALLEHPDIDIHLTDVRGHTAFERACMSGKLEVVKIISAVDQGTVNRKTPNGYTPLHHTIQSVAVLRWLRLSGWYSGDWREKAQTHEVVKYLLSLPNVNVNEQGANGMTPLHIACQINDRISVQSLLAHPDIQINVCNATNATPLHLACQLSKLARMDKEIIVAKALLETSGVDVTAKDSDGKTAMDYAKEASSNANNEIAQKARELIELFEKLE